MLTFDRASITDADAIAELSGVLGYPVTGEEMRARLTRILAAADETVLVARIQDGGVVGWIHGAEQELLETGRRCEILGLVVSASQRKQGLGRELVREIEQWARERGLEQLAVRSNVLRNESHVFYQALGFERVKTQHAYWKLLVRRGPDKASVSDPGNL